MCHGLYTSVVSPKNLVTSDQLCSCDLSSVPGTSRWIQALPGVGKEARPTPLCGIKCHVLLSESGQYVFCFVLWQNSLECQHWSEHAAVRCNNNATHNLDQLEMASALDHQAKGLHATCAKINVKRAATRWQWMGRRVSKKTSQVYLWTHSFQNKKCAWQD